MSLALPCAAKDSFAPNELIRVYVQGEFKRGDPSDEFRVEHTDLVLDEHVVATGVGWSGNMPLAWQECLMVPPDTQVPAGKHRLQVKTTFARRADPDFDGLSFRGFEGTLLSNTVEFEVR